MMRLRPLLSFSLILLTACSTTTTRPEDAGVDADQDAIIIDWVVVDGVSELGTVLIRDPWAGGSSYQMTAAEFMRVWSGIGVFR